MRTFPQELLIRQLKGTLPKGKRYAWANQKSPEECLEILKRITDIDLGLDAVAWEKWWKAERKRLDIDPEF